MKATWTPPRPDFSKPPTPGNEAWRREDVQALAAPTVTPGLRESHAQRFCREHDYGCPCHDLPGTRPVMPCPVCEHARGDDPEPARAALASAPAALDVEHSPHCCSTRKCHDVCSHGCGTKFEAIPICNCSDYCRTRQPRVLDALAAAAADEHAP